MPLSPLTAMLASVNSHCFTPTTTARGSFSANRIRTAFKFRARMHSFNSLLLVPSLQCSGTLNETRFHSRA